MCGRYNILPDANALLDAFGVILEVVIRAQYNIAPSQTVPVVVLRDSRRVAVPMRWGFVPHWQKQAKPKFRPINARDDHVIHNALFRDSWKHRRCLLPASGFYEWKIEQGHKQPYLIHRRDGAPFFMAGVWDRWAGDDVMPDGVAVITTTANEVASQVHDRMPVILDPDEAAAWLLDEEAARALMRPYAGAPMETFPVSTDVNSPRHDDASLLLPLPRKKPGLH